MKRVGSTAASSSSDRTVKIWNLNTKQCVSVLEGHQDQIWEVAYSPGGDELCSVSDDASVQVYSLAAAAAAATKPKDPPATKLGAPDGADAGRPAGSAAAFAAASTQPGTTPTPASAALPPPSAASASA